MVNASLDAKDTDLFGSMRFVLYKEHLAIGVSLPGHNIGPGTATQSSTSSLDAIG